MFYQVSLFDAAPEVNSLTKNPRDILQKYLGTIQEKNYRSNVINSVVRYFIPAIGGPIPSAAKRRPLPSQELNDALEYLETVSLEIFANASEITNKSVKDLALSEAQKNRIQRSLKDLVDWARKQNMLPLNPLPQKYYKTIQLGKFKRLPLKEGSLKSIYEQYLKQLNVGEEQQDLTNAIVRYFVPSTGGPVPVHKPAFPEEVQAALQYLERLPREYLSEAVPIATEALDAMGLSLTQSTRIRSALRGLIEWAISENYIPDPNKLAPWGEIYDPPRLLVLPTPATSAEPEARETSVQQIYRDYCEGLDSSAVSNLQHIIVRHFVPACGGPDIQGRRASAKEIQSALIYLQQITLEQLYQAIELTESRFNQVQLSAKARTPLRVALKRFIEWVSAKGYFDNIERSVTSEVQFRTFRNPGQKMQRKKPGRQLHDNRSPVHALGSFPGDYINPRLEQDIAEFQQWRQKKGVTPGTIKGEYPQILQVMGWLYRYEGIPLDELCFEKLIFKSQLRWSVRDYNSFEEFDWKEFEWTKQLGKEKAFEQADQDAERIKRYLEFSGNHPGSRSKRLCLYIAMAKFIYREVLGKEEFTYPRSIPILARLLDLQKDEREKAETALATVDYAETSAHWEDVVIAMEMQRRRADKFVLEIESKKHPNGFKYQRRPDTAMANELQRFLSIAFLVAVFPSRSRTYYDLRIGETLKEGINPGKRFIPKSKFAEQGITAESKFYLHHLPEDFKTGRAMTQEVLKNNGWWVEIPNTEFPDGKCLYDYIYRWLNWGREIEGTLDHNFFFRKIFSSSPMTEQNWKTRIRNITERWTGVPIPTRNFRIMWSTYLEEQKAPQVVQKGAQIALQHSEKIHAMVYNLHPTVEQTKPALDFNQGIVSKVLQNLDQFNCTELDELDQSDEE